MKTVIKNARIVGTSEVHLGSLIVEDGLIEGTLVGRNDADNDWRGDFLIPGLIDVHTDNLEKHYMPRTNAPWDSVGAAIAHDGQVISAGITTVFDSLSAHGQKSGFSRGEVFADLIGGLDEADDAGMLKADHLLHIRCEVANPELPSTIERLAAHSKLSLLSVMDHTPGQGQWGDLDSYRTKLGEQGMSSTDINKHIDEVMGWRDLDAVEPNRSLVFELGNKLGISIASHDDRRADQIASTKSQGGTIAEFPLTLEAAKFAKDESLWTVFGAPNFVRGGSHSGNVSVRDVAEAGCLDALCSDYIPHSMLRAAFLLTAAPFEWSIVDAIKTVTAHPAALSGLTDRGEIRKGKRADFVRVRHEPGAWPVVKEVWVEGDRVA